MHANYEAALPPFEMSASRIANGFDDPVTTGVRHD